MVFQVSPFLSITKKGLSKQITFTITDNVLDLIEHINTIMINTNAKSGSLTRLYSERLIASACAYSEKFIRIKSTILI
jgi:hypothetical protein